MSENDDSRAGLGDKISGRLKETVGDLTGNEDLKRRGTLEEAKGEAKEDLDRAHKEVERRAGKVADLERPDTTPGPPDRGA